MQRNIPGRRKHFDERLRLVRLYNSLKSVTSTCAFFEKVSRGEPVAILERSETSFRSRLVQVSKSPTTTLTSFGSKDKGEPATWRLSLVPKKSRRKSSIWCSQQCSQCAFWYNFRKIQSTVNRHFPLYPIRHRRGHSWSKGMINASQSPNQMVSLILLFGFLCRSSYFQIQVTEKYSTAMC